MKKDKKEIILDVAEEFIAKFGIKRTSMDDIARKARMGKSTIYYYFESKEEIFSEVIRRDIKKLIALLENEIQNQSDARVKLLEYIVARMKHLQGVSSCFTTLSVEYLENYFFIEEIWESFYKYEIESLISILDEGIEQGLFRNIDTEKTAKLIGIALKGLENQVLIEKKGDTNELSRNLADLIINGVVT